jgi:hypothetical protein
MIRPLTTLVLCGVLGSMVLVGNAEACHKRQCGCAPVVCAAPKPIPFVTYAPCAPKVKHCGFKFKLPTLCHKKPVCTTTVAYCSPAPVYSSYAAPSSYPAASPQASAQH